MAIDRINAAIAESVLELHQQKFQDKLQKAYSVLKAAVLCLLRQEQISLQSEGLTSVQMCFGFCCNVGILCTLGREKYYAKYFWRNRLRAALHNPFLTWILTHEKENRHILFCVGERRVNRSACKREVLTVMDSASLSITLEIFQRLPLLLLIQSYF